MRRPDRLDYEAAPVSDTPLRLHVDHSLESTDDHPSLGRSRLVLAATLVAVVLIAVALVAVATLVATALFHGADDMDYTVDYEDIAEPTAALNATEVEKARKRELMVSARKLLDKYYRLNNGVAKVGPLAGGRIASALRSTTPISVRSAK